MIHGMVPVAGELREGFAVAEQLVKLLGQMLRVFRAVQQTAAEFFEHLRKAAVAWLNHRHRGGERFENKQALGFTIDGRHSENIDVA